MTLQVKERVAAPGSREWVVPQTEALLKRLVEHLDSSSSSSPARVLRRTSEAVDEIVFEATIDGTQYYVVRSHPQSTAQVSLSPRELAIARLIAKGFPNKCIGEILDISPWTVATHLRRIFMKLDVTSRAAMVAQLLEKNLL